MRYDIYIIIVEPFAGNVILSTMLVLIVARIESKSTKL